MRLSRRDELVSKALETFYQNGFHATGMERLVAETGVSKTAIYTYFRNKEELILAVLRRRDEMFRHWLFRRMAALADNPEAQLLAMFDALREWFNDPTYKGCLFIKASCEYQDRGHPIHRQAAEHKRILEGHITNLCIAADFETPNELARQLLLLKEGAIVSQHLQHTKNPACDAQKAAAALMSQHPKHRQANIFSLSLEKNPDTPHL